VQEVAGDQAQKRGQLRLQKVMYPGGKRVERVTIDERVSGGVTKAGAELSIMRKGICTLLPSRMGSEQSESQGR